MTTNQTHGGHPDAATFISAPQMTIRQRESETVAPYSASFQRTMISAILKAEDGGVSQVCAFLSMHVCESQPICLPASGFFPCSQLPRTMRRHERHLSGLCTLRSWGCS